MFLFKEVAEREAGAPVGVQIVGDLLSFTDFDPFAVLLFVDDALGIGLAESVLIRKVTGRDEKIHLHAQSVGGTDHVALRS